MIKFTSTQVKDYRHPYLFNKPQNPWSNFLQRVMLRKGQWLLLSLMIIISSTLGFTITYRIHNAMLNVNAAAEQLRTEHQRLANEHIALLAARAQLSSKERVLEAAQSKFQLFEPSPEQLRRM